MPSLLVRQHTILNTDCGTVTPHLVARLLICLPASADCSGQKLAQQLLQLPHAVGEAHGGHPVTLQTLLPCPLAAWMALILQCASSRKTCQC